MMIEGGNDVGVTVSDCISSARLLVGAFCFDLLLYVSETCGCNLCTRLFFRNLALVLDYGKDGMYDHGDNVV